MANFARRKPLGFGGMIVLLIFAACAILAPIVSPFPYSQADFSARLLSPNSTHLFGTDNLGRDLFSRVLFGIRVSMAISFAAVLIAKVISTAIGMISGFYGGPLDDLVQRIIDVWLAIPALILLITLLGVMGPSITSIILVIGLIFVPGDARLVRSVVVGVRHEAYIEAARTVGCRDTRLLLRYVLPNIMHIIVFSATISLGSIILLVATIGFLGYGVPPPQPDLGGMLSGAGLQYMRRDPWMAVWPGLAITLIVFSFNVFGDALRDVLDPRMRGSR